jgi:hypothetical protein
MTKYIFNVFIIINLIYSAIAQKSNFGLAKRQQQQSLYIITLSFLDSTTLSCSFGFVSNGTNCEGIGLIIKI